MKIELFSVCDFAADYAGKLTVVGVFDTIFAKQTPVVHPHWCIAIKLRFEKIEEGEKRVRLSISDADGKNVLPAFEMPIVAKSPDDAPYSSVNIVANIGGAKLPSFGEYSVNLAIDGRHEGSIPLWARQLK